MLPGVESWKPWSGQPLSHDADAVRSAASAGRPRRWRFYRFWCARSLPPHDRAGSEPRQDGLPEQPTSMPSAGNGVLGIHRGPDSSQRLEGIRLPLRVAVIRAVSPFASAAFGSAPAFNSFRMMAVLPLEQAK